MGNYATIQIAPALKYSKHVELRGIVTGPPSKAIGWSEQYSIKRDNIYNYNTFDSIVSIAEIDIVYFVLPNFMHAEYKIRVMQAGKHINCEKPIAMNPAECKSMITASKKANKKLQIGYRLFTVPTIWL